ncbi:hypothetical protein BJ878DRAFT_534116 [Calycina marina]|uniref:Uncharacterized protein n=1 Tax=Calycina marina TaxID=1763456 RepID=A0A9P7Z572_9HELO|nr:hypothetical protein BJ878DRAFT_534116 [Calycina marina]
MAIRMTPHIVSRIDRSSPIEDPLRSQFIPLKSDFIPDHPELNGNIVHQYPDKMATKAQIRSQIDIKGLCVAPSRTVDSNNTWTDALFGLSNHGKQMGKEYLHTHSNHPNEISWVTTEKTQKLFQTGVRACNQPMLLRGINDTVSVLSAPIRELIDNHVDPYYVYQCNMAPGIDNIRTLLSTIHELQHQIRGSIGGYSMPQFVVNLPGGGGKRLAADYLTYNHDTGLPTWKAP